MKLDYDHGRAIKAVEAKVRANAKTRREALIWMRQKLHEDDDPLWMVAETLDLIARLDGWRSVLTEEFFTHFSYTSEEDAPETIRAHVLAEMQRVPDVRPAEGEDRGSPYWTVPSIRFAMQAGRMEACQFLLWIATGDTPPEQSS